MNNLNITFLVFALCSLLCITNSLKVPLKIGKRRIMGVTPTNGGKVDCILDNRPAISYGVGYVKKIGSHSFKCVFLTDDDVKKSFFISISLFSYLFLLRFWHLICYLIFISLHLNSSSVLLVPKLYFRL